MRLSIDLSPRQHRELKAAAAREGKTVTGYILQRTLGDDPDIVLKPGDENSPEVEPLRRPGEVGGSRSSQSVEEIFEDMMKGPD